MVWTTAAYLAAHSVWQKAWSMAARTVFATAALRDGHWAALWAFRLADCWVWRSVAWTVTTMAARTDERKAAQKAGLTADLLADRKGAKSALRLAALKVDYMAGCLDV